MRLCEKADVDDMEGFKQTMRDAACHYGGTHEALGPAQVRQGDKCQDKGEGEEKEAGKGKETM